jgi:AraC-like DNA-binding protein
MYEVARRSQQAQCGLWGVAHAQAPRVNDLIDILPRPTNRIEAFVFRGIVYEIVLSYLRESGDKIAEYDLLQEALTNAWRRRPRHAFSVSTAMAIESGLSDALTVPQLPHSPGCHDTTLRRDFRRAFSMSMKRFQMLIRAENALRMLAAGNRKLMSVAQLVGYKGGTNFSVAMKTCTGKTARELCKLSADELLAIAEHLHESRMRVLAIRSSKFCNATKSRS